MGGVLGSVLSLPVHGISAATANFETFNEVLFHFKITPRILAQGMLFAIVVGAVGGYLPARHAARAKLVEILRD
jgi:ABC-type antimicrobial peptide transport system permease subunit